MIIYIFIGLIILSTIVAFTNWRNALFMLLVVGLLQDTVRKLTPGAPVLFVLSTLPIWCAIAINLFSSEKNSMTLFFRTYVTLVSSMRMFAIMMIPGAVVMLMRGLQLWKVVLLGAFGYLAPIFGIIVGFVFSLNMKQLVRLLTFYCFFVSLMLSGTVMEYMNIFPDWQAIGSGAMKMVWVKYVSYGHTIYMKSGFFRSPDIMGWHGSMMAMISLTLFFSKLSKIPRWTWLLFAVWGVICIVISGRYKMIAMPMIWAISFSIIIFLYHGIGRVVGLAIMGILVIVGFNFASTMIGLGGSDYTLYAKSSGSYSVNRVDSHAVSAVVTTYKQAGIWGNGLGSATQGARHAGIKFKKGWQEGGLSKIMGELGVLGLFFFLLLFRRLFGSLILNFRRDPDNNSSFSDLRAGLLSIVAANGASFVVSSQVYSDLFVLSIISMCIGFILSGRALSQTNV